ncbi:MAG TPA: hypothetical protein VFS67_29125 [Polyangiaceae bacterium]|nr:hypothetical protein [Polyangiaceae bacterium]
MLLGLRLRWAKALFGFVLPLCLAVESWAADAHAGTRILLLEFGGRASDVLREKVKQSLEEDGNTVVLAEQSAQGQSRSELARLAKNQRADVIVDGVARRQGMKSWLVSLRVLKASTGASVGGWVRFKNSWLPGLTKDLLENSASKLSKSLSRATKGKRSSASSDDDVADPPESAEPAGDDTADALEERPRRASAAAAPVEESSESSSEESSSDASYDAEAGAVVDKASDEEEGSDSGRIRGAIGARAGMVHRKLDFSDDIYDRLRKQDANIWVYQLQGELYPFDAPIGDKLGVIARYEGSFSGNVRDADFGGNFSVIYHELFGGLRARYPLGANAVGFELTVGNLRAGLDDPSHRSNMPEVSYTQLRSALDFDLALGPVHAIVAAGFRLPLGYGEIKEKDWFPRVGGYGVEATGTLEYALGKSVSLDLTGSLRRYLLEMNSTPQDAMAGRSEVAGGAVDLYTALYLGMTFRL